MTHNKEYHQGKPNHHNVRSSNQSSITIIINRFTFCPPLKQSTGIFNLNPISSKKITHLGHFFAWFSRCVPRPWNFSSGMYNTSSFVFFLPNQHLGEVLSSQIEETSENTWCNSIVARVWFISPRASLKAGGPLMNRWLPHHQHFS